VFGKQRTAFNLDKVSIDNLTVDPVDVKNGIVDPDAFKKYIPVLAQWISSAANGDLNHKARAINVYGIGLAISGSIQNRYIAMQL
jgi:hypothetical protein